jgi:tRNA threonylcarbamoyladenosine biosynthesis protein TsaE
VITRSAVGPITVREVGAEAAADVVATIHASFGAREVLAPASTATDETTGSVAAQLAEHGGLLATSELGPVGALLFDTGGPLLGMRRVAVRPDAQGLGVAGAMVAAAERLARDRGYDGLRIAARTELPRTIRFWEHLGYTETERSGVFLTMVRLLPVETIATTAERTRALGERLAGLLRAGDLLILNGDLGAGKTTFAQGVGAGLDVRGPITSPTFVISRVHPPLGDGPPLVHVDAYRLGSIEELDDLDLDTSLDEAVTMVEWGSGVAEGLAQTRLEVAITRGRGDEDPDDESRRLVLAPVGARWIGAGLRAVLG